MEKVTWTNPMQHKRPSITEAYPHHRNTEIELRIRMYIEVSPSIRLVRLATEIDQRFETQEEIGEMGIAAFIGLKGLGPATS